MDGPCGESSSGKTNCKLFHTLRFGHAYGSCCLGYIKGGNPFYPNLRLRYQEPIEEVNICRIAWYVLLFLSMSTNHTLSRNEKDLVFLFFDNLVTFELYHVDVQPSNEGKSVVKIRGNNV